MGRIDDLWPLFGLRLRSGGLEMRVARDDDLAELAELTREPIHAPDLMPFFEPWTDQPEEQRVRSVLQWQWRARADWAPDNWRLELVAVQDGQVVGTQGVHGRHFSVTREVETGSWVGRRFQGRGVGTAMRRAALHLAFAGLGAETARSGAFSDNGASLKVSARLGYSEDGTESRARRGEKGTLTRLLLRRDEWEERSSSWPSVELEGLEPCLVEFGLAEPS